MAEKQHNAPAHVAPRPTETDPPVIRQAAERSLERLRELYPDEELGHETLDLLVTTLAKPWRSDGYERARDWEREGWQPDFELVEFLNDLSARREHDDAVREWVRANDIRCAFAVGDHVTVPYRRGTIDGEITHLYEATAVATVCCSSLGHVREGIGTHGILVAYENLQPKEASRG